MPQSRLLLDIPENSTYSELLSASFRKQADYNPDIIPSLVESDFQLLYKSGQSARLIPGTKEVFSLQKYREASGKVYSQIVFVLDYFQLPDLGKLV